MIDWLCFRLLVTKKERAKLNEALRQARQRGDVRVSHRILTILAIADGEQDLSLLARVFRVSSETIRQWVKKYVRGGLVGLVELRHSPGRPVKLTKRQRAELILLIDAGPQAAGFSGGCWRSPMIQDLIDQHFGVFYNVKYLSQLLESLGFSYQKAAFEVGGQNPDNRQKRQEWLTQRWPQILAGAKAKGALLLFGDEASFPQWGTLTYTWAKKGQQPKVKTSGIRKGYKVFGLIEYFSGKFFYQAQTERMTSQTYQAFLQQLLDKTTSHLILIQDGARYHTSKAMLAFFAQHAGRITVETLPAYSPDFNPIEKLWKKIKEKETHLHYFPTFESLTKKVDSALLHFTDLQHEILTLFGFYKDREAA